MEIEQATELMEKFKRCNDVDPIDCRGSRCSVCENRYNMDDLFDAIDIAVKALRYCEKMNIDFDILKEDKNED